MTKREKLRYRLRNNPKSATMQEVETLLLRFGFILQRISGSHHVFRYEDKDRVRTISVPVHGNKVKTAYVIQVIELIDDLFPEDTQGESEVDDD